MLNHKYEYGAVLEDALKVAWKVEDLIGGDKKLDFSRPFLPESLAGVNGIQCLSAAEKLKLNQIRGNSYLYLFGFVEEFILPYVIDHAKRSIHAPDKRTVQALMTFAEEEAKHMHLFMRFAEAFAAGFPVRCGVIGPASAVAAAVLSHSPLGVGLVILHLEWMTQAHYVDSIKADQAIDPLFSSMLRHHWMEEAQHAKLDTLVVDELAREAGPAGIERAFEDYLKIGGALDGLLAQQVQLDLESLAKATGRAFTGEEKKEIVTAQTRAYRWTFLGSGMKHPNFIKTVGELSPAGQAKIAEVTSAFC